MELLGDDRRGAPTRDEPRYRHRQDCPAHDESEGRVPGTGDVEERPYPRRIDHAGNGKAGAEQRAVLDAAPAAGRVEVVNDDAALRAGR